MTTGSYEESLSMEGIPDHQEVPTFTRRHQRWSRQSSHPPTRTARPPGGRTDNLQLPRRWERRRVNHRRLRQGCQRLDRISAVGRKRPRSRLYKTGRKTKEREFSVASRSAEAVFGRRETSGPPVMSYGA